jgi:glycine cleavage system pyridoxal-binding protein P
VKLTTIIGQQGVKKLAELTTEQASGLAAALEKKFLDQQAKETFSPGSDGQV